AAAASNVTRHEEDLLVPGTAARIVSALRPELLVHAAWFAVPSKFWAAQENLAWVAATLELHGAFVAAGGRRGVYLGSCAEYDWSHPLLSEAATPLAPHTLYGLSKACAAQLILRSAEALPVTIAWARIFWLYGPGEPRGRLVSDLASALLSGASVDCTDGRQERDFMHVADVASAIVAVMRSAVSAALTTSS